MYHTKWSSKYCSLIFSTYKISTRTHKKHTGGLSKKYANQVYQECQSDIACHQTQLALAIALHSTCQITNDLWNRRGWRLPTLSHSVPEHVIVMTILVNKNCYLTHLILLFINLYITNVPNLKSEHTNDNELYKHTRYVKLEDWSSMA